ncbi:MAG: hypothetical protein H7Y59_06605 [Anaerolineales bacterium]|nr:hypothetical protein [Anaerolineales bacterium]
MKRNLTFLIVLLAIGLFIFLGIALGRYSSRMMAAQIPEAACTLTMADIIQSAKGNVYEVDDPNYIEPASYNLVTYSVSEDEIINPVFDSIPSDLKDEQQDTALQKEAWQIFTTLIPSDDRQMVTQYMIFTDGSESTLAAVEQTEDDLTNWIVEVDLADLDNKDALFFTLIHEYAHLLTLNESQVSVDEEVFNDPYNIALLESKAAACPNYFDGSGCSLPNSYINTFHQRFWVDINDEWEKIDSLQYADDLSPYYDGLYNFYLNHQDQFVDDYSTTHPAEDIAESFAYFVFSPKPEENLIKDQKILFFYEYPELIELREQILNNICTSFPE